MKAEDTRIPFVRLQESLAESPGEVHADSLAMEGGEWSGLNSLLSPAREEAPEAEPEEPAPDPVIVRREALEQELGSLKEQLIASIEGLVAERKRLLCDVDTRVQELVRAIVEHILCVEETLVRDSVGNMTAHALSLLAEADDIVFRVHPKDRDWIQAALDERVDDAAERPRLVCDESIGIGGFLAESKMGCVDATFSRRLAEATAVLTTSDKVEP